MKTLTTLTAVAALIAGMSIASAQTPASQSPQSSPSDINKGSMAKPSGSQTPGSAMTKSGATSDKQVATGTGKFCVEISAGGAIECKYASLAACEKDAKPQNHQCSPNPKLGTTGSK